MKVLRPGRQPAESEWSREVTCTGKGNGSRGCQALLSINKDDLFKVAGVSGMTWYVAFKCPECGKLTDIGRLDRIHSGDIPPEITANLMPRLAWEAKQVERAAQQQAEDMVAEHLGTFDRATKSFRCHRCGSIATEGSPYCVHCDLGAK